MREPGSDDALLARLTALRLGSTSLPWVPDQSGYDVGAPDADPAPAGPERPQPGLFGPGLNSWWTGVTAAATPQALLGLVAVCLACLAVTAYTLWHHRAAPAAAPPLPAMSAVAVPTPTPTGIVVDVGGRVRHPGLVTLPAGARVDDALRAAGGALRPGDLDQVNLAARVTDGQLLLIGVPGGAAAAGATSAGDQSGPVNLNSATVDQLDELPGIGPVLAERIVDWRTANGGFRSVDDLNEVSGIGDTIFAELSPLVTV